MNFTDSLPNIRNARAASNTEDDADHHRSQDEAVSGAPDPTADEKKRAGTRSAPHRIAATDADQNGRRCGLDPKRIQAGYSMYTLWIRYVYGICGSFGRRSERRQSLRLNIPDRLARCAQSDSRHFAGNRKARSFCFFLFAVLTWYPHSVRYKRGQPARLELRRSQLRPARICADWIRCRSRRRLRKPLQLRYVTHL